MKGLEPKLPRTKAHAMHWFRSRAPVTAYSRCEGEKKATQNRRIGFSCCRHCFPAISQGREEKKKSTSNLACCSSSKGNAVTKLCAVAHHSICSNLFVRRGEVVLLSSTCLHAQTQGDPDEGNACKTAKRPKNRPLPSTKARIASFPFCCWPSINSLFYLCIICCSHTQLHRESEFTRGFVCVSFLTFSRTT